MDGKSTHIIYFTYDVREHSMQFPLQAEVDCSVPGIYTVTNIRADSQKEGSLLPPIRLRKDNGFWIFVENGQQSNLSASIGKAIELRFDTANKNTAGFSDQL